jgi:hypothetical protein
MKNITVTVDDDLYRHARICAAYHDTTLTALVRDFLITINTSELSETDIKRLLNKNEDEPSEWD